MLEAHGIARRFGKARDTFLLQIERTVLEPGSCVAVTGPSGCGKSTLLGLLALALRPDPTPDAVFTIGAADALGLWRAGDERALARLRGRVLGFVPQTAALLGFLSLRENIALPQAIADRRDPSWIDAIAEALGLRHVLGRRPADVSVGQRQRAAIARALAHRPAIVFADEPTASVHPAQAGDILRLLHDVARETGTALLMATHDPVGAAAAGFALAPCEPLDAGSSRFAWPSRATPG